ncbi:hypothetical protein [Brevibacillus choshinensis]|uniref:Uncharacterized protein n=1 Tax=Brevibacillus choshinensis TaxID=54911 RepID=A0ABX7FQ98_BRECH|nr:hypothetical protein [Brevibacillus choshinensis]QRG67844.1 hypothetical protein JNE38_01035 [Brevibacillus choshinensis]
MFHQMNRFVSRFRDLEQQELFQTREEEQQWKLLKDKLAAPSLVEEPPRHFNRSCIAVTSLYAQAGASFIASNVAYAWAGKGIPVTLSEMPNAVSYLYFALDYERRAHKLANSYTSAPLLLMQNNQLRIQIDPPLKQNNTSHIDPAHWLLRICKDSPLVVIDVSSRWKERDAQQIFELADEIWVVFDADLARLTRMFLVESAPSWWTTERSKIKLIANKWNQQLSRSSVMKRVEGTLSLWNPEVGPVEVEYILPLVNNEKPGDAQVKGKLLLEDFAEEEHVFQPLIHTYKGRVL